jgi:hypothetical protein
LSMAARVDGDIVKAPGMYILHSNRTFEGGVIWSCLTLQCTKGHFINLPYCDDRIFNGYPTNAPCP